MDYNRSSRNSCKFSVIDDIYFEKHETFREFIFKNIDEKNNQLISDNIENNLKASLYIFISYILYSIVNLLGKVIGFYYPLVENSITNLFRGIFVAIICHIYFVIEKIDLRKEFNKPYKKLLFLLIRCFFGALCNFILFESFKYMRISSSFTIFNTSPIFVSILTVIFLNGKFNSFDILTFIVCFLSVCMITKPSFLFGSSDDADTNFGIFLSILSAIFSAVAVFTNKVISKDFNYIITIYVMALSFILISILVIPFTQYGFSTFTIYILILTLILSIIFYYSLGLFVQGINIGDPIKVLPITYVAIVMNLIYNTFIFKQACDWLDIIGSLLIIMINIIRTIYQKR